MMVVYLVARRVNRIRLYLNEMKYREESIGEIGLHTFMQNMLFQVRFLIGANVDVRAISVTAAIRFAVHLLNFQRIY